MDLGLSDKKAIVTGSTKGIGRAIAETLLAEGASVAICARDKDSVAEAVDQLGVVLDQTGRDPRASVVSDQCDPPDA